MVVYDQVTSEALGGVELVRALTGSLSTSALPEITLPEVCVKIGKWARAGKREEQYERARARSDSCGQMYRIRSIPARTVGLEVELSLVGALGIAGEQDR